MILMLHFCYFLVFKQVLTKKKQFVFYAVILSNAHPYTVRTKVKHLHEVYIIAREVLLHQYLFIETLNI